MSKPHGFRNFNKHSNYTVILETHTLRIDSYDFDQLMLNDKQVGWILINSRRSILAILTIETK